MTDIVQAFPLRRSRTLATVLSTSLLALLVLGACSPAGDDDDQPSGSAGSGGAGSGTGGSGASGSGSGGAAHTGSGGSVSSAGGSGTGGSGAGGSGAGGSAAGSGGSGAVADAGAPDADVSGGVRPAAVSLSLPTTMENPMAAPWFNVYRPTDLTATGQPLPVVVWANGGCYRSDFTWAPLFERWAAGGFVVLALTESPEGGALATSSVDEHGALIDWALAQAAMAGSPYAGKLDTERVVAAGNSCGGVTALGVAAEDDRVAAVFVLSGSSALGASDKAVMSAISVPVGFIVGSPDEDVANGPANMDYDLLAEGIPAMVVNRSTGDHITVSTDEKILPQDAEIALNWMDLALYGTAEAADALKSANVCASCEPGTWTLKSKHLQTLLK